MKKHFINRSALKFIGVFLLISASSSSYGHHSFAATFDTNTTIEVDGVVTDFSFANPHVIIFMDVTDEEGAVTNWMAEGAAASNWRRGGWDSDSLKAGDIMRISGNATHDGSPMVALRQMSLLNPDMSVLTQLSTGQSPAESIAEAQTQVAELAVQGAGGERGAGGPGGERGAGGPGGERGAGGQGGERGQRGGEDYSNGTTIPLTLPTGEPNFTGLSVEYKPGGGPGEFDPAMPYNELGQEVNAAFDIANDPQVFCEPPGVVRQSAYSPYGFEIVQYPDHITIEYEEFGTLRAVFFGTEIPKPGVRSHMGDSVARYEGDALIIETVNILGNLSGHRGQPLSENARVTEVYTREDNPEVGSIVKVTTTVVDPTYLTEPWTISRSKYYVTGYEYIENSCQSPLRERPDNLFQYSDFDLQFVD